MFDADEVQPSVEVDSDAHAASRGSPESARGSPVTSRGSGFKARRGGKH